uniref:Ribosome biogenesis protein NOP53 n=1 Tax=Rhabditophanes sp. KR3021 TaxID=114890 RepID=A0AC35UAB4_9BILA
MPNEKKFVKRVRKSKRNGEDDRKGAKKGTLGKKTKKTKAHQADPFNVAARFAKIEKAKKINKPIVEDDLDKQSVPRAFKDMQAAREKMKLAEVEGKNKKAVNHPSGVSRIEAESNKLGFQKKYNEDDRQLVRRVAYESNQAIEEQAMLAKFGMAGRSQKEINKDMQDIKDTKQRKKDVKKQLHERRIANIKTKEEKVAKEKEALKLKRRRSKMSAEEIAEEEKELAIAASKQAKLDKPKVVVPTSRFKINEWEKEEDIPHREFKKMIEKSDKLGRVNDARINVKEKIKFNEVVSEPPKFSKALVQTLLKKSKQKSFGGRVTL